MIVTNVAAPRNNRANLANYTTIIIIIIVIITTIYIYIYMIWLLRYVMLHYTIVYVSRNSPGGAAAFPPFELKHKLPRNNHAKQTIK